MLYLITRLPAYLFYPVICLWSLGYGVIGGIYFKLVAMLESWWFNNRLQLLLWKKYPQRSYQKYINNIWSDQIPGRPVEVAAYTRNRIEQVKPSQPFPLGKITLNTLTLILLAPFVALTGVVEGPLYVFRRGLALRQSAGYYQTSKQ